MSKSLTQLYIDAFSRRDIDGVAALLHEEAALEDPVVNRIEGKAGVVKAVQGVFASCEKLDFSAKNIFVDGATTLIEFRLVLDATVLEGVDIIDWQDGRIRELRAYLDIPK